MTAQAFRALALTIALSAGVAAAGEPLCTCLAPQPPAPDGVLVGTIAISMRVPGDVKLTHRDRHDGDFATWEGNDLTIGYANMAAGSYGHDSASDDQACHLNVDGFDARVTRTESEGKTRIDAQFDEIPVPDRWMAIDVSGKPGAATCQAAGQILRSLVFVGDWRRFELLDIAADRRSFTYRVESGEIRKGALHSEVTATTGKVTAMHSDHIDVLDLAPIADHRYREVWRVFAVDSCKDPTAVTPDVAINLAATQLQGIIRNFHRDDYIIEATRTNWCDWSIFYRTRTPRTGGHGTMTVTAKGEITDRMGGM